MPEELSGLSELFVALLKIIISNEGNLMNDPGTFTCNKIETIILNYMIIRFFASKSKRLVEIGLTSNFQALFGLGN
jgi:hypothetical protein